MARKTHYKVKSQYLGVKRCLSHCLSCCEDWSSLDVEKARRAARRHTMDTGHETIVEQETSITYRRDI
jgi:hypothetical protein